jgi:hypothetical protein
MTNQNNRMRRAILVEDVTLARWTWEGGDSVFSLYGQCAAPASLAGNQSSPGRYMHSLDEM